MQTLWCSYTNKNAQQIFGKRLQCFRKIIIILFFKWNKYIYDQNNMGKKLYAGYRVEKQWQIKKNNINNKLKQVYFK